jgi:transcriptional regulator
MFVNPRKVTYPSDKQVMIWKLKRDNYTGREIAKKLKADPGYVSRSLKKANERIKELIKNAARMNKIKLDLLNEALGLARGHSHMFNIRAYITYSPVNGVQVWYDHEGDCMTCEEFAECKAGLIQEFKERNLEIPSPTIQPTDLSELLVKKIEELLE